jgi:hypothetical protein
VIVFTDRQRAVLAEHGIAVSDRGVIAEITVFIRCRPCGRDVPADHACPAVEAVA